MIPEIQGSGDSHDHGLHAKGDAPGGAKGHHLVLVGMAWHHYGVAIWYGAVMQYGMALYCNMVLQYGIAIWYGTILQYGMALYCNMVWRCIAIRYGAVFQHSMALYFNIVWHCIAIYGIAIWY
jgi:hypothetical protein